jgi:hypothetical protein
MRSRLPSAPGARPRAPLVSDADGFRAARWSLTAAGLVASAVACGPSATPAKGLAGPAAGAGSKPVATAPARWIFHPSRTTGLRARLDLSSGTLYGGDGGERWLDKRDGSAPIAANTLVAEPIAALAKHGSGIAIVGRSGAIHLAPEPLAPVVAKRAPPAGVRAVAAGRQAILAIVERGLLRTTDAGSTWTPVELQGRVSALADLAIGDGGLGLALGAPQKVWVTTDDGATWAPLATPGIGARRLVLDVNGDLVLEGLEASALLRTSPPRLERIARAPRTDAHELSATNRSVLGFARAIARGRGAFVDARYLEALPEPEDPRRWRVAFGPIGEPFSPRRVAELDGCENVWTGGDARSLWLACDDHRGAGPVLDEDEEAPPPKLGKLARPSDLRAVIKLFRSDDEGKTWRTDGVLASRRAENGRIWIAPDRSLIVDGGCKRARGECWEGPPVVRPDGQAAFAKVSLPRKIGTVSQLAFGRGGVAFGLGRAPGGPLMLLSSRNFGKDFSAIGLPTVTSADPKQPPLSPARAEPVSISVDERGAAIAVAQIGGEFVVYVASAGGPVQGRVVPHRADLVAAAAGRILSWERHGRAFESADAGATWIPVAAPAFPDLGPNERVGACTAIGCLIADRATRLGWGGPAVASDTKLAPAEPAASALACTAVGPPKSLGTLLAIPGAYEAELGNDRRWLAIKHDPANGKVSVLVAKQGLETREVTLFGPAARDTATAVMPQVEGAAAIRFGFRREAVRDKKSTPAIVAGQKVDVDVAWYVAGSDKIHRATVRGVGPLDPLDVASISSGGPAAVNVSLLSIAHGGIHVRPFATRPEVPLYFVKEGGGVERLAWPELPAKDAGGAPLVHRRIDAVRAGGRSVVLSMIGSQMLLSWADANGWESRTWGLWPDLRGEASWDFAYLPGTPPRPTIVVQATGDLREAFGVSLGRVESDPTEIVALPTQASASELACPPGDGVGRYVLPALRGTRRALVVRVPDGEIDMVTGAAALRTNGCVLAYEARTIGKPRLAKADDASWSSLVPWGDKEHAVLFRTAAGGETTAFAMRCAPSAPPAGFPSLGDGD